MACYHPLKGWRSKELTKSGKRKIVFNPKEAYTDQRIEIACGQCRGCRLERSRQWAVRCIHEASMYEKNCFVTLTYDNENLPKDNSLYLEHFQEFIKKLRRKEGTEIRYYHCGEYGEETFRPHYHVLLFNYDFDDKSLLSIGNGTKLYTSDKCNKFWKNRGHCTIGDVTFQSAAYVARYIMKKHLGPDQDDYYCGRKPEYTTMSRRPGIGKKWLEKYGKETYHSDFVVIKGKKVRIPKYYDGQQELDDPDGMRLTKIRRQINAEKHLENNTRKRLAVREKIQELKIKKLKRGLENET